LSLFTGIGSRIAGAFGYEKKAGPTHLAGDESFWKSFSQLAGASQGITQPYSQSVWVYASVKKISTNISGTPFKFYTKGNDDEKVEITEGELVDLFDNPNSHLTSEQLWEATQTYLDLRGEAFWVIERPHVAAIPEQILVIDPLRMQPAFNKEKTELIGWVYSNGKTKIPFQLHEIVHYKYFNPDNPLRGIAPYRSIAVIADQDYFANVYNRTFFKEGAAISGFVELDKSLTDSQFSRLLNYINDRHQGVTRAHRIGLLENGGKFKETKLSQKDMDFIESKKMNKKEIFTAYGTNDVVLGFFEDVKSFEGQEAAMKAFWEGTLLPRQSYLQGVITSKFLKFIDAGNVWGEFDISGVSALKEGFTDKVDNAEKLFKMGYPLNAINKRLDLGMEEVAWGDVGFLPANTLPIGSSSEQETEEEKSIAFRSNKKLTSIPAEFKEIKVKEEPTKLIESKQEEREPTEKEKLLWKQFLDKQLPIELKFKSKIRRYFMEQRVRVLTNLNDYFKKDYTPGIVRALTDDVFDKQKELKEAEKALLPLYSVAMQVGAEMIADELDVDFTFEPLDPSFLKYQEIRITKITPEMLTTVENGLRTTLTEGIAAGETVAQLSDRVKGVYNFAISRATTIARTESASMINAGRFENMLKQGVTEHEWFTALDEHVRDTHDDLHGAVAEIGKKFRYVKGIRVGQLSPLKYPTDMGAPAAEVINCRCITLPVVR